MYKLVYYPDPGLLKSCEQVTEYNKELHDLLDAMKPIMQEHGGIGLSANQVGSNKRVFIMQEQSSKEIVEFINPTIVEQSNTLINDLEACLSYPGATLGIPRPQEVVLEAVKRTGEAFTVALEGVEARCALHEIEHLNGQSFLNSVNRQQRRAALRTMEKLNRGRKTN